MITWKKTYLGREIVEIGMYKDLPVFSIYTDRSTGFTILQGIDKLSSHYSRHIDLVGAKKRAESEIEWRKL